MRLEVEATPSIIPFQVSDSETADHQNGAATSKEALDEGIKAAQAGDRVRARAALLRATEYDPRSENAWLWLASISEYPEELMAFLENVLAINPHNERALQWIGATRSLLAKTFVQRGMDAAEANKPMYAEDCFQKALAHDENNTTAWLWLASLSESTEQRIKLLERVLAIEPGNAAATNALHTIHDETAKAKLNSAKEAAFAGNVEEALSILDSVVADSPQSEDAWMLRSHLAVRPDEKMASLERVLEINPENAGAKVAYDSLNELFGKPAPKAETPVWEAPVEAESVSEPKPEEFFHEAPVEAESVSEPKPEEFFHEAPVEAENVSDLVQAESVSEVVFSAPEMPQDIPSLETEDEPVSFDAVEHEFEASPDVQEAADVNDPFATYAADPEVPTVVNEHPDTDELEAAFEARDEVVFDVADAEALNEVLQSSDTDETERASFPPEWQTPDSTPDWNRPTETYDLATLMQDAVSEVQAEAAPETAEAFDTMYAIPMPDAFEAPLEKPTGFETTVHRSEKQAPEASNCPFCSSSNEHNAFVCQSCFSVLTLSDLEGLLSNTHADKFVVRTAVEEMEKSRNTRSLTENELTMLGIGHLNLRNLQYGYNYLHEASQLNPNNVVLTSQVNALLIRLEEIRLQDEVHAAMPKGKTILVVDDSATVRKLIAGKLEKSGHQVFCSGDGVEAMERLQDLVPDLILLDITMPRMDGYQACKMIRGSASTKDVPVVMISGKDGFFDKVRGRMAGTTGYITKPFGPETLMKAVEYYLGGGSQEALEEPMSDVSTEQMQPATS